MNRPQYWFSLCLCLFLTVLCISVCYSQNQKTHREKVHIHFDKQSYAAGDTVWFKAYVVVAGTNELSALSKVLHFEFIEGDKIKKSILLPLVSGTGRGDIVLPDSLKEGRYRVRAYTNWMRNFGSAAFFDKLVPVVNGFSITSKQEETTERDEVNLTDVNFFPEGGEFVEQLRSKVGIKAIADNGTGVNVSGTVTDQDNNVVSNFKTEHAGIGTFPLLPVKGKQYTAVVQLPNGRERRFQLPSVKPNGYVLTVNNREKDTVYVSIAVNSLKTDTGTTLVVQGDNAVYYAANVKLQNGRYRLSIARSLLPLGISRFTLSSAINGPLAERLVFNDVTERLKLRLSANKDVSTQKTVLNIQVTDDFGKPQSGSFSATVINLDKAAYDEAAENTIQSDLLLTSDVKGFIEQPNYYFTANNKKDSLERAVQLDNLLLTQGWRKFVWEKREPAFAPEEGLQISGKLLTRAKKPIPGSKVSVFAVIDSLPFLADTLTGNDGSFSFKGLDFDDETKFTLQAKEASKKYNVAIQLDSVPAPAVNLWPVKEVLPLADYMAASKKRFNVPGKLNFPERGIRLKEVIVTAKKKVYSSNSGGLGSAEKVISNERIKRHHTLKSVLETEAPFIKFDVNNQPKNKSRRFKQEEMITLVDGIRVDNGLLQMINPKDVESIELVMNGGAGYMDEGVIVINTKNRDPYHDYSKDEVNGIITFRANGYAKSRAFYVPRYEVKNTGPDLRDVVYWNPDIIPNDKGEAKIDFKTAAKGTYRVIIEGISVDGKIGTKTLTF